MGPNREVGQKAKYKDTVSRANPKSKPSKVHGSSSSNSKHAVLPPLPPAILDDVSINELLHECEAARRKPLPDHIVAGIMEELSEPDNTSSEDDDVLDELPPVAPPTDMPGDSSLGSKKVHRGLAKPHYLAPGQVHPKAYIYLGELVGDEVSGWFLPEIRFEWTEFWDKWKNVDDGVKERLWTNFKNYFDMSGLDMATARHLFYKQSNKWYREAMCTSKRDALTHVKSIKKLKSVDVMDMIGTVKPSWIRTNRAWQGFIRHWTDPDTIRVSNSAKRSRATRGAGIHGLGRVGLKNRMRKREEASGVRPSPFEILHDQNRKKNKVTGLDEVRNEKFDIAWGKYEFLFKAKYGQDCDPKLFAPDFMLYDAIEEVALGHKRGRRLGLGSNTKSAIFHAASQSSFDNASLEAKLDEMRVEKEEETAHRRALEEELEVLKMTSQKQQAKNEELTNWMLKLQEQFNQSQLN